MVFLSSVCVCDRTAVLHGVSQLCVCVTGQQCYTVFLSCMWLGLSTVCTSPVARNSTAPSSAELLQGNSFGTDLEGIATPQC